MTILDNRLYYTTRRILITKSPAVIDAIICLHTQIIKHDKRKAKKKVIFTTQ